MSDITITLIQTHLHWEDAEANKKHFESLFKKIEKESIEKQKNKLGKKIK